MPSNKCGSCTNRNKAVNATFRPGRELSGQTVKINRRPRSRHMVTLSTRLAFGVLAGACAASALNPTPAQAQWQPTRPVEFIIPAGTGGGADQMARTIQGIVTKHNLMKTPLVVINKAGGAGG